VGPDIPDVSEARVASIFRAKIKELGTTDIFYFEYEGDTFLRNVGANKTHTAPHCRRWRSVVLENVYNGTP
jgi:hypothetical protein